MTVPVATSATEPADGAPIVLALVGQTASGKNRLAVEAAEVLRDRHGIAAEILSLDSMKIYRGMAIGTAAPSAELRARIPHHLLEYVDPAATYNAGRWFETAEQVAGDIRARGATPIYVGGTGMYLHFLVHGHFEDPTGGTDPELRERLHREYDTLGGDAMHARLRTLDPASADRLHPNDRKRIVRALEVTEQLGTPLSEVQQQATPRADLDVRIWGLRHDRDRLDARINQRCAEMFDEGWIDETLRIRDARTEAERDPIAGAFGPQAREALGYREILAALNGTATIPEPDRPAVIERVAQRTRRFARKQMTWFKRFPIAWLDTGGDAPIPREEMPAGLADAWAATVRGA